MWNQRLRYLRLYKPDVFFLNEFNFAWWKEVITDEDAILKKLPQYTFVKSRSLENANCAAGVGIPDEPRMLANYAKAATEVRNRLTSLVEGGGGEAAGGSCAKPAKTPPVKNRFRRADF